MVMFAVMVIIIDGEQILVFKMAISAEIDVDDCSPGEGWVLKEVLYKLGFCLCIAETMTDFPTLSNTVNP